jgi:cell division protease FtsH
MSTGAGNDLERATMLARRMVTEYGMSERLGVMTLGSSDVAGGESRNYSEHAAQQIDREVRRLVDEAYARARSVIVEQRTVLDRLAHALLQLETLQGPELERMFAGELATSSDSRTALRPRSAQQPSFSAAARPLPAAAMGIEPQER